MFPKGGMGGLYKQAQAMQKKMANIKEELKKIRVEGVSGGEMIKVIFDGNRKLISVNIDNKVLEEDREMVEDLILVAVNQALDNAQEKAEEKIKSATGGMMGGMNIPGL